MQKRILLTAFILSAMVFAFSFFASRADARTHYSYASRSAHQSTETTHGWVRYGTGADVRRVGLHKHKHRHARKHRGKRDANGNIALAVVTTANGLTAKAATAFADKFQTFIKLVEADTVYPERPDLNERGNRIGDIGCYTRGGHMPGSKHYRGLACDIDQIKRNVTSSFMYHVTPLARMVGLTDGGTWPRKVGERYTGPDAGHIEVPTAVIAQNRTARTYAARRHHHRRTRYASR